MYQQFNIINNFFQNYSYHPKSSLLLLHQTHCVSHTLQHHQQVKPPHLRLLRVEQRHRKLLHHLVHVHLPVLLRVVLLKYHERHPAVLHHAHPYRLPLTVVPSHDVLSVVDGVGVVENGSRLRIIAILAENIGSLPYPIAICVLLVSDDFGMPQSYHKVSSAFLYFHFDDDGLVFG